MPADGSAFAEGGTAVRPVSRVVVAEAALRFVRGEGLDRAFFAARPVDQQRSRPANLPAAWAALKRRCERPCPVVLRRAGELCLRDQILGVPARMPARKRVVEAVAKHGVVRLPSGPSG